MGEKERSMYHLILPDYCRIRCDFGLCCSERPRSGRHAAVISSPSKMSELR